MTLFPIVLLHLSCFRRLMTRLRLHPRHATRPTDNDDLPREVWWQRLNIFFNPVR